jgi:hypothetical protein
MTRVPVSRLLAWTVLTAGCSKQAATVEGPFDVQPAAADLGELDEWEEPEVRFRFRNVRDHVVHVTGLEASCVCTSMALALDGQDTIDMSAGGTCVAVPAAAGGSIVLRTKLRRLSGRHDFVLRCFTDDQTAPITSLRWVIRVRPYCDVVPDTILLDEVGWERETIFSVMITPKAQSFRIVGHAPVPEGWRIEIREFEDGPPRKIWIAGACDPRRAKVFAAVLTLRTDGRIAEIAIPVTLRMKDLL